MDPRSAAEAYALMLEALCLGMAEESSPADLPREMEVQSLWRAGMLGHEGETLRHGSIRIIDFGEWNRSAGPDFLQAEFELDGVRVRGDVEIDTRAQDWECHGHGANPGYDGVVLHVVLTPPPRGWYTRDSRHRDIPILPIPEAVLRQAAGLPRMPGPGGLDVCSRPLEEMPLNHVSSLLQSAAAYRFQQKRRRFLCKTEHAGQSQAWFEALAETLGYHANKLPMQLLASRAPLRELRGNEESILFGTAGFLAPVLPEAADGESRLRHRAIWDAWWPVSQRFTLNAGRSIPWQFANLRPQNHPHRRVAALALAAGQWKDIKPLLGVSMARRLVKKLASLSHPYWDTRYSLASPLLGKRIALVGRERALDFLVNHVFAYDASSPAWETFLQLKTPHMPGKLARACRDLFGGREDVEELLSYSFAQQGVLQILADYCTSNACKDCDFPARLTHWMPRKPRQ